MARFAPLLLAALFVGAASPGGGDTPLAMAGATPPLVVTSPQPAAGSSVARPVFLPAPMPDPDLDSESLRKSQPAQVELTPNLFHQQSAYWGEGYTPNSAMEGEQNRKLRLAPELNLSVPLN